MSLLLALTTLCQACVALEGCVAFLVTIILSDGVMGHPGPSQMAGAAALALVPLLLVVASPFLLVYRSVPATWYFLLLLNFICAFTLVALFRDGHAIVAALPAGLAFILLLVSPLRGRFFSVHSNKGPE